VIDGKPTILISYSVLFQDELARTLAKLLDPFGFRTVLVGDEPLPPGIDSNPNSKVEWFFRNANMAVFLATPDDRLQSGVINPPTEVAFLQRRTSCRPPPLFALVTPSPMADAPGASNPMARSLEKLRVLHCQPAQAIDLVEAEVRRRRPTPESQSHQRTIIRGSKRRLPDRGSFDAGVEAAASSGARTATICRQRRRSSAGRARPW
jgi:hypothetical protein